MSAIASVPSPSRPPIRVVLADDAFLVRTAVRGLLDGVPTVQLAGECDNARDVPELCDRRRADVVITDVRMPPSGSDEGIRLAARLRTTHPAIGVIVLTAYADVAYALRLFEAGADGRAYLLKDRLRDRAQLVASVHAVADGRTVIDPTIVGELVQARGRMSASGLDRLTRRELETLALIAEGHSNAAIAARLVLTKRAVEKHVNSIFAKLQLGDPDRVSRRVRAALTYLAAHDPALDSAPS